MSETPENSTEPKDATEETQDNGQPPAKKRRFEPSYVEDSEWNLPNDMAEYFVKQCSEFIKPSEIEEHITSYCPPPKNIGKVKLLDNAFKEILTESGKKAIVELDETLMNVQSRIWDVLGPFSQLWMGMETDKDSLEEDEATSDEMREGMANASTLYEKTVTLIGQTVNNLLYQRRYNVLSGIFNDKKRAKSMIKEHKSLIDHDDTYLFGEKFEEKVVKTQKMKLKTKQLLKDNQQPSKRTPFRGRLLSNRPRGRGRAGFNTYYRSFQNDNNNPQNNNNNSFRGRGKNNFSTVVSNNIKSGLKVCPPGGAMSFPKGSNPGQVVGRKVRVFSGKLGTAYKRPLHFKSSSGLSDSLYSQTGSMARGTSKRVKDEQGRGPDCYRRGREFVKERGNRVDLTLSRPGYKHIIHSKEKGQRLQASHQSKICKFTYPLSTLQDGGFASNKRSLKQGRSNDKTRLKRCLFQCTIGSRVQKICQVRMERQTLPIPVYVFRSWSSSKAFYKINESSCDYFEEAEYQTDCLPRRYSSNRQLYVGVSVGTRSGNRVFGSDCQLLEDGIDFTIRESGENSESVRKTLVSEGGQYSRINKTSREVNFLGGSSVSSTTSLQEDTKESNKCPLEVSVVPHQYCALRGGEVRTEMVVGKPETLKREVFVDVRARSSDVDRCLKEGLGSGLSRSKDRGSLEPGREWSSHKHLGTEGSPLRDKNLHNESSRDSLSAFADGQYISPRLHCENGGDTKQGDDRFEPKDMGILDIQGDHDYCRISPRKTKCISRLGVQKRAGFQRMETGPQGFQQNLSGFWNSSHRPICIKGVSSDSLLRVMETRPLLPKRRCFSDKLGTEPKLRLPTILPHRSSSGQVSKGAGRNDSGDTSVAGTTMVSKTLADVCSTTPSCAVISNFVVGTSGSTTPLDEGGISKSSGLACFRKTLETEGISGKAAVLISNSRRKGSISHYESAWGKWSCWASERQADPTTCSLSLILEFLADLFEKKLQYSTICGYRSAISAYHIPIEGQPVGRHPRVSALLTGVFNLRPPLPRYSFVWDVSEVLEYIRLMPIDDSISNKDLTLKLSSLMAIASASRASEICYLDIRYLVKGKDSYEFHFVKLTKSWRRGKPRPKICFHFLTEEPALCICKTIDQYLTRSKGWRSDQDTQLLLSHRNPHDPVAVGTVSRWLMELLDLAGINTDTFSGHSTRHASTSKAKAVGIPLKEIVKKGQWSSDSMFRSRYCQEVKVTEKSRAYENTLFKKALNKEG